MEGFGLVEALAVERAHPVGVCVALSAPESTVPVLTAGRVAGCKLVALQLLNFKDI